MLDSASGKREAAARTSQRYRGILLDAWLAMAVSSAAVGAVVTQVVAAPEFWRAEEYHQRYFEKNGGGHCKV